MPIFVTKGIRQSWELSNLHNLSASGVRGPNTLGPQDLTPPLNAEKSHDRNGPTPGKIRLRVAEKTADYASNFEFQPGTPDSESWTK